MTGLDVLIPTCQRPDALAVTLAGLAGQTARGFRVVVSDQTPDGDPTRAPAVAAVLELLRMRGHSVVTGQHLPALGIAEHRAHLLAQATAPQVLFLDDDVWLEPDVIARLMAARAALGCGFVGAAPQGAAYRDDVRPREQDSFVLWDGPVVPERVRKGEPGWERWRLHNAANLTHLTADLALAPDRWRAYKIAWIFGCVLFDRAALLAVGGFDFWRELPAGAAGEDVVAQLRVMERAGGAGIVPSGAWHLGLPTTVTDRRADAYTLVLEDAPASPG